MRFFASCQTAAGPGTAPRLVSMRGATCAQTTAKPTSASAGMPSEGQSALSCSTGRSPIARRSIDASHPRPSAASVPSALSISDATRWRNVDVDSAAASTAIAVSRHYARADDALVALQPDRELLEIGIRFARVEDDAVDEAVLRGAIAVRAPREVVAIGEAFFDKLLRRLEVDVRPINGPRDVVIPLVGFTLLDLAPAAHLR